MPRKKISTRKTLNKRIQGMMAMRVVLALAGGIANG
jgi:hypothetical protein